MGSQAETPAPPQYGHIDFNAVGVFTIARDLKFQVTFRIKQRPKSDYPQRIIVEDAYPDFPVSDWLSFS